MKNVRPMRMGAAGLLAAAAVILLASSLLVSQDYEKICPISFGLYPGTKLETSCAARIEQDNVKLSGFLSELRMNKIFSDSAFNPWRDRVKAIISDEKTKDEEKAQRLKEVSLELVARLEASKIANPFLGTYLEDPKLTTEEGITVIGIAAVVVELKRIVSISTYVDAQSVHVALEYLPFKSDEYGAAQYKYPAKNGEEPVDMIAHIKTVLAYAPKDAPVTIEGLLPHRTICFYRE